jgi:hypothetical protein
MTDDNYGYTQPHVGSMAQYDSYTVGESVDWESTDFNSEHTEIEKLWQMVRGESDEHAFAAAEYWRRVSTLLDTTAINLRRHTDALLQKWKSPAATDFARRVGATLHSLEEWRDAASSNADGISALAVTIAQTQQKVKPIWEEFRRVDKEEKDKRDKDDATFRWLADIGDGGEDAEDVRKRYTDKARPHVEALAKMYFDTYIYKTQTAGKFKGPVNAVASAGPVPHPGPPPGRPGGGPSRPGGTRGAAPNRPENVARPDAPTRPELQDQPDRPDQPTPPPPPPKPVGPELAGIQTPVPTPPPPPPPPPGTPTPTPPGPPPVSPVLPPTGGGPGRPAPPLPPNGGGSGPRPPGGGGPPRPPSQFGPGSGGGRPPGAAPPPLGKQRPGQGSAPARPGASPPPPLGRNNRPGGRPGAPSVGPGQPNAGRPAGSGAKPPTTLGGKRGGTPSGLGTPAGPPSGKVPRTPTALGQPAEPGVTPPGGNAPTSPAKPANGLGGRRQPGRPGAVDSDDQATRRSGLRSGLEGRGGLESGPPAGGRSPAGATRAPYRREAAEVTDDEVWSVEEVEATAPPVLEAPEEQTERKAGPALGSAT